MTTLTIQVPDFVLAAVRRDPQGFAEDMRIAAAALWYREGKISQEVASQIAGLDRTDFLLALARLGQDSFHVDWTDLDRELGRG